MGDAVQDVTRTTFTNTLSWLDLTKFQLKLWRDFSVIIFVDSLLVLVAWRIYGARIRAKFMTGEEGGGETECGGGERGNDEAIILLDRPVLTGLPMFSMNCIYLHCTL